MKRGRKKIEWTNEMLKKLEMEYCIRGKSIQESAKKLGLSYGVVRRKLEELGWLRRYGRSRKKWTKQMLEELYRLYCVEGKSIQACARELGVSDWNAKEKLREMGVVISKSKKARKEEGEEDVVSHICVHLYNWVYKELSRCAEWADPQRQGQYKKLAVRTYRLIGEIWGVRFRKTCPLYRIEKESRKRLRGK